MKTLGISGKHRHAAAAIAVDGRVVAATAEECLARVPAIGYSSTGAPLHAVAASLAVAGLDGADIDEVIVVDDDVAQSVDNNRSDEVFDALTAAVPRARTRRASAIEADALQASAAAPEHAAVLVCSAEPAAFVSFRRDGGVLKPTARLAGADRLVCAARTFARALGMKSADAFADLDRPAAADPEYTDLIRDALAWSDAHGITVDVARINDTIETVRARAEGDLADAQSQNVRVDEARRALAASVRTRVAQVVHEAARHVALRDSVESIALGGSLFANAQLNTELRRLFDGMATVAQVPEAPGRSLGAALSAHREPGRIDSVSIGPAFSDSDIKRTLDNCRLDYVYEPDWRRVIERTSRLLSQGKVVAWFQGPMAFGPRPLGSRSILCDPSLRYARENMNEYLRQVPLAEPLPVAFAPTVAAQLSTAGATPFATYDAAVTSTMRDRLRSALNGPQHVRINGGMSTVGAELRDLLEHHYARTNVPALIETPLCASGEPAACTPRDAVRTVYSAAIDALIIGRFVLMKDYWLLRTDADV